MLWLSWLICSLALSNHTTLTITWECCCFNSHWSHENNTNGNRTDTGSWARKLPERLAWKMNGASWCRNGKTAAPFMGCGAAKKRACRDNLRWSGFSGVSANLFSNIWKVVNNRVTGFKTKRSPEEHSYLTEWVTAGEASREDARPAAILDLNAWYVEWIPVG